MPSALSLMPDQSQVMHSLKTYLPRTAAPGIAGGALGYTVTSFFINKMDKDAFRNCYETALPYFKNLTILPVAMLMIPIAVQMSGLPPFVKIAATVTAFAFSGVLLGMRQRILAGHEDVTYLSFQNVDLSKVNLDWIPSGVQSIFIEDKCSSISENLPFIPTHVITVNFWDMGVKNVKINQLPETVESITFRSTSDMSSLQLGTIGKHIKRISFTDCDLNGVDFSQLPTTLKKISLEKVSNFDKSQIPEGIEIDEQVSN